MGGGKLSPSRKAGRCHLDRDDTRLPSQQDALACVAECRAIESGRAFCVHPAGVKTRTAKK